MSESLFARACRSLGPLKLHAQLASVRLTDFVADVPDDFANLTALEVIDFLWELHARPEQLPPAGDWDLWIYLGGRGTGKTKSAAEATIAAAQEAARWIAEGRIAPEEARLHIIAGTSADLRDTVVEGPAGLLRCSPPWFPANYEPSKRRVTWAGGPQAMLFSAEEAERLRGPQCLFLWADEFCSWRFAEDVWQTAMFGLRLGPRPRAVITTTPRPSKLLRQLLASPRTVVTRGSTKDNIANLAPSAVERLYREYGGTRLGRQELEAEILEDNPGALWRLADIDATRVAEAPELRRVVVAIDPAVTSRPDSDETGIIVCGVADCRCKCVNSWDEPQLHAFVLRDASGIYTPDQWARTAVSVYELHHADRVVAEVNNGGELVEATLKAAAPQLSFTAVHASRGKQIRAEPIAALYEQRKVHHVGSFSKLEDQMVQWNPLTDSWSPDRLDALVWAVTELLVTGMQPKWTGGRARSIGRDAHSRATDEQSTWDRRDRQGGARPRGRRW